MSRASWRPVRAHVLFAGLLLTAAQALSHGYVQQPMARQQFCERDGGYWWPQDGSGMPNAACRAAFLEAGTFQFVQNIEYAINVQDYNNIAAVKTVLRDGTLCAAGDNAKRGMNLPHASWQRTVVTPRADNSIEVLFFASTPHNPSFWEFYLTRPGFDGASRRLSWADLDLIGTAGNVTTETIDGRRMYRFNVPIPSGRVGDAILFTRWQRRDPGGEGFYNCSDITIAGDTGPVTWYDKGVYLRGGITAEAQDEVWFRTFDSTGRELVFEKLAVAASNQPLDVWAAQLAGAVNSKYSGIVQIGVRNSDGSIGYSTANAASNRVWLTAESGTFALDIKKPQPNQECASRTQLSNGCKISNLSMNVTGGSNWITLQVPAGASNLVITTSGGTGNADVYVSAINWATPSSYQFRSVNAGNGENVTIQAPIAGAWYYISVYATAPYDGLAVQSTWQ